MNPETHPFNLDISVELTVFVIAFVLFIIFLERIQKFFRDSHDDCDGECLIDKHHKALDESIIRSNGSLEDIRKNIKRDKELTPRTFMDDGEWYAFYGDIIQHGSFGVGDTEEEAINNLKTL